MIEVGVLLVAVVFDALRDRNYPQRMGWSRDQWRWHVYKWIAFYTPLVYVVADWKILWIVLAAFVGLVLWRGVYTWPWVSSSAWESTAVLAAPEENPEHEF